jgi:hypothetical protein
VAIWNRHRWRPSSWQAARGAHDGTLFSDGSIQLDDYRRDAGGEKVLEKLADDPLTRDTKPAAAALVNHEDAGGHVEGKINQDGPPWAGSR